MEKKLATVPTPTTSSPPAGSTAKRTVTPTFAGSGGEYFRIWIVNLFFTLMTLGVYSAWAKVRRKRYFYACTDLDGDRFDYIGNPIAIIKGRLIAVTAFLVYAFVHELYPATTLWFLAAGVAVGPWLLIRAWLFNARNSCYRGLRFDFSGTTFEAVKIYLGTSLIVGLTAGLAYPLFIKRHKQFVMSRLAYGETPFDCELKASAFFGIYFVAGLIFVVVVALMGAIAAAMHSTMSPASDPADWKTFLLPAAVIYGAYLFVYAFVQSRVTNLVWNSAQVSGVGFRSTLTAWGLARLYLTNLIAAACSLGLLIPWAVVRTLRYRLDNFAVVIDENRVYKAGADLAPIGAAGQEFGDIFNIDFGA